PSSDESRDGDAPGPAVRDLGQISCRWVVTKVDRRVALRNHRQGQRPDSGLWLPWWGQLSLRDKRFDAPVGYPDQVCMLYVGLADFEKRRRIQIPQRREIPNARAR